MFPVLALFTVFPLKEKELPNGFEFDCLEE
jgi:hypothetical protein